MTDIDAMQKLIQEKLAEITILHEKMEKAIADEENAKRIKEETDKWYAEENEKAIREAEEKRVANDQKKLQDAIEKRRVDAEAMDTITMEEARIDLFRNKNTPFVFQKYLRDFGKTIVRSSNQEYMTENEWLNQHVHPACGRMVRQMFGCEHGKAVESISPNICGGTCEPWTYIQIAMSLGPCSQWTGHIGCCWEGTFADNRAHAGATPVCSGGIQTTDTNGNPIDFEGVSLWKNMTYQY